MMFSDLGKLLLIAGLVLAGLGVILMILPSTRLGRLPGDLAFSFRNTRIFIPITTSILLSILLTLILWLITIWRR